MLTDETIDLLVVCPVHSVMHQHGPLPVRRPPVHIPVHLAWIDHELLCSIAARRGSSVEQALARAIHEMWIRVHDEWQAAT
jgi:hypothetical protein